MAVYFLDSNGKLWATFYSTGQWAHYWADCGVPPRGGLFGGDGREIEVSNDFDYSGNFLTSVWAVQDSTRIVENHGPYVGDRNTRTWNTYTYSGSSVLTSQVKPVAVTWYDRYGARTPAYAHTRVMIGLGDGSDVLAFYRGDFGTTMLQELLGQPTISALAGGAYVQGDPNCPTCFTQKSLVMTFDNNTKTYNYLAKDNIQTNPLPPWTALPPPTGGATSSSPFTRVDMGGGTGPVYVINNVGHLVELDPVTNGWTDSGQPGHPERSTSLSRRLPQREAPRQSDGAAVASTQSR